LVSMPTAILSSKVRQIFQMLRQVEGGKFENLTNQIELYHLGNCLKCGRVLTDSESIRIGLGPICRA
jgi:hypothetical protein